MALLSGLVVRLVLATAETAVKPPAGSGMPGRGSGAGVAPGRGAALCRGHGQHRGVVPAAPAALLSVCSPLCDGPLSRVGMLGFIPTSCRG